MKQWIIKAGIRAIKTFAQTLLGFMAVGLAMSEIQWGYALSVSTVALIASLLTSIAGLPELKNANSADAPMGDVIVDPETSNAYLRLDSDVVRPGDTITLNVVAGEEQAPENANEDDEG